MATEEKRVFRDAITARARLIECLRDGARDKRELVDCVGKSVPTVDRWLRTHRDLGAVRKTSDGFELTLTGQLAEEEIDRHTERMGAVYDAKPLLGYLPTDAAVDMRLLAGAEVHVSEPVAPLEPVGRLEELVVGAEGRFVQGTTPNILPQYVEFFREQVVDAGLTAEFVLGADVMDYLLANHREAVLAVIESGRGTFARLPGGGLSFGLAIVATEGIWVGVHENGDFRGAIVNTEPAAIEWAEERFESLRERATTLDVADLQYRGGQTRVT